MKTNWIIGVGGTTLDWVNLYRVYGSKDAVKEYLLKILSEDRDDLCASYGDDYYEYGTEFPSEVEEKGENLYAYTVYGDTHFDYVAIPESEVDFIEL